MTMTLIPHTVLRSFPRKIGGSGGLCDRPTTAILLDEARATIYPMKPTRLLIYQNPTIFITPDGLVPHPAPMPVTRLTNEPSHH
jgi:hypothetical protein